ncbi:MAG TPA: hypothetical protein VJ720_08525 [Chitinophaga sp.]|nr:hypothetical protein [Chitinophaga sp.]
MIHIPTPCHEDWNNMLPANEGRHCLQCCKTVVDFTNWETADIIAYFEKNAGKKTCGRFRKEQMDAQFLARQISFADMPVIKKIAAVILVVLGLSVQSCDEPIMGKAAGNYYKADTIPVVTMGEPRWDGADTTAANPVFTAKPGCGNTKAVVPVTIKEDTVFTEEIITGDVVVLPPDVPLNDSCAPR